MSTADVCLVEWEAAYDAGAALAGGKGWNLARLRRYGFQVPDGLVLLAPAYRQFMAANDLSRLPADEAATLSLPREIRSAPWPTPLEEEIRQGLSRAGWLERPLAVRSSALGEDSTGASFAGIHSSFLNVVGPEAVFTAIKGCYASLWSERALVYRRRLGLDREPPAIAVVIMPLLEAESAGIAFSCDPASGRGDQMLIAANFGLGEAVVADATEADSYRVGWTPIMQHPQLIEVTRGAKRISTRPSPAGGTKTLQVEGGSERQVLSDEQICDLARLVRRVHLTLGEGEFHQDVEWVFADGQFHIVQARPVTALPRRSYPQLAQQQEFWSNANLRDALPMVQTPLNWSRCLPLIEYLFYAQYRAVGYQVDPSVPRLRLINGRAYFNLATLQWECYDAYGLQPAHYNFFLGGHQPQIELSGKASLVTRLRRFRRSLRLGRNLKRISRRASVYFEQAITRTDALRETDLATCSDEELAGLIEDQGELFRNSPEIMLLLSGGGAVFGLLTPLLERYLPERGLALTTALLAGQEGITSADHGVRLAELAELVDTDPAARTFFATEPFAAADWQQLPENSAFYQAFTTFLADYGHRCVYELDYRTPRWDEDPSYLLETIRGLRGVSLNGVQARQEKAANTAWDEVKSRVPRLLWPLVRRWITAGGRDGANREMAKSILVRMGDVPRQALLEIGRRLVAREVLVEVDDIFFLYWPEIVDLVQGRMQSAGLKALVADRCLRHAAYEACAAPDLVVGDQPLQAGGNTLSDADSGAELQGIAVASGHARGVARLIHHPHEGNRLVAGEILVAPSTDPAWTPLFLKAAALVTETGGILSHGAIVAREYGIPAVLNVRGALQRIADGQRIRVDGDRGRVAVEPD